MGHFSAFLLSTTTRLGFDRLVFMHTVPPGTWCYPTLERMGFFTDGRCSKKPHTRRHGLAKIESFFFMFSATFWMDSTYLFFPLSLCVYLNGATEWGFCLFWGHDNGPYMKVMHCVQRVKTWLLGQAFFHLLLFRGSFFCLLPLKFVNALRCYGRFRKQRWHYTGSAGVPFLYYDSRHCFSWVGICG